jgi:hypothetical protein
MDPLPEGWLADEASMVLTTPLSWFYQEVYRYKASDVLDRLEARAFLPIPARSKWDNDAVWNAATTAFSTEYEARATVFQEQIFRKTPSAARIETTGSFIKVDQNLIIRAVRAGLTAARASLKIAAQHDLYFLEFNVAARFWHHTPCRDTTDSDEYKMRCTPSMETILAQAAPRLSLRNTPTQAAHRSPRIRLRAGHVPIIGTPAPTAQPSDSKLEPFIDATATVMLSPQPQPQKQFPSSSHTALWGNQDLEYTEGTQHRRKPVPVPATLPSFVPRPTDSVPGMHIEEVSSSDGSPERAPGTKGWAEWAHADT